MGMFDSLKYAELQQECKARDLPAGGTAEELLARLNAYEADSLLLGGNDDGEPSAATDEANALRAEIQRLKEQLAQASSPTTAAAAEPEPVRPGINPDKPEPRLISFPAPDGEVSTEQNTHYRTMAYHQAVAEGLVPKGGLAGVRRSGWDTIDGVKHAVYEVTLRK